MMTATLTVRCNDAVLVHYETPAPLPIITELRVPIAVQSMMARYGNAPAEMFGALQVVDGLRVTAEWTFQQRPDDFYGDPEE